MLCVVIQNHTFNSLKDYQSLILIIIKQRFFKLVVLGQVYMYISTYLITVQLCPLACV
jgi:hypothetical protein